MTGQVQKHERTQIRHVHAQEQSLTELVQVQEQEQALTGQLWAQEQALKGNVRSGSGTRQGRRESRCRQ
jgi:hypothetical protein